MKVVKFLIDGVLTEVPSEVLRSKGQNWFTTLLDCLDITQETISVDCCTDTTFQYIIAYMKQGNTFEMDIKPTQREQLYNAARYFNLPGLISSMFASRIITADIITNKKSRLCSSQSERIDLSGAKLVGQFYNESFRTVNMSHCNVLAIDWSKRKDDILSDYKNGHDMSRSICEDVQWPLLRWEYFKCVSTSFGGSSFYDGCVFKWTQFDYSSFKRCRFGSDTHFFSCTLPYADLFGASFGISTKFIECTMHHTKLIHMVGTSISFKSCDFAGALIENCDLPKCNIEQSYFSKASISNVNFKKSRIGNSMLGVLVNVDFSKSIMPNTRCIEVVRQCRMDKIIGSSMLFRGGVYETTFTWANLCGSIFFGPVEKCVFYYTDLSDAIFENGSYDLESEMFRYANFNQTFINGGFVTRPPPPIPYYAHEI